MDISVVILKDGSWMAFYFPIMYWGSRLPNEVVSKALGKSNTSCALALFFNNVIAFLEGAPFDFFSTDYATTI